jgi:hypothetical protein
MSFLPGDIINNVNDENNLLQFVENENKMEVLNENEKFYSTYLKKKQNFKKAQEKITDGLVA